MDAWDNKNLRPGEARESFLLRTGLLEACGAVNRVVVRIFTKAVDTESREGDFGL